MSLTAYIYIFVIIAILQTVYIAIARKAGIVSVPCRRSSHLRPTVSGGGIVFYFAVIAFYITTGMTYTYFAIGATILAAISFADDLHPLGVLVRMAAQIIGVTLAAMQLGIISEMPLWATILVIITGTGFVNACNFMDGVNGITGGYSLLTLLTLYVVNRHEPFITPSFLIIPAMAAAIFCFCNIRRHALCFAGDVGSVTVGYILLYAIGSLIDATHSIAPLVFVAVYGVDTVLTIIHRMMLRQNILQSHRMHLYQIISNEMGLGHIATASLYIGIQALINVGALWLPVNPVTFLAAVIALLSVIYIFMISRRPVINDRHG